MTWCSQVNEWLDLCSSFPPPCPRCASLAAGVSVSQVSILSYDPFPLACSFSYTPFAKLAVEAKLSFQISNGFVLFFFICKGDFTDLQIKEGA